LTAPGHPTAAATLQSRVLFFLAVAVTLALGWILAPLAVVLLWSAVIAMLFAPVQRLLLPRLAGRHNLAALSTLGLALVIVVLPVALVAASLVSEAAAVASRLQSGEWNVERLLRSLIAGLPAWLTALLERFGLGNFALLQQRLTALLSQASGGMATRAMSLGQNAFDLVVGLFMTIYLAFFMIRDGEAWAKALRRGIPLPSEDKRVLFEKFNTVVRATVKGNLLVAALQGALGGVAFWFLDVSAPVLWAALMAVLSLLPAVGAALVWGPVAAYLFLTGSVWQGVALCAYGVLVIGLVDNLLRPLLVGKDTRMPDAVVLVATLGGMAVFGVHGFVLGPAIAAMAIAVWHLVLHAWADDMR